MMWLMNLGFAASEAAEVVRARTNRYNLHTYQQVQPPMLYSASNDDLHAWAMAMTDAFRRSEQAVERAIGTLQNRKGPYWYVVSGATTAVSGDHIMVDTSGGAVTITLPADPRVGDYVRFGDYAVNWGTNNLTVTSAAENIEGSASDLTVSTSGAPFTLTYIDATEGWVTSF